MANPFSNTLRSLSERHTPSYFLGLGLILALLAAWGAWFVLAPVTLYAESAAARLEAEARPHAVATRLAGEVVEVAVALSDSVEAGDLVVRLDDTDTRRLLDAERAALDGALDGIERLDEQIAGERASLDALRRAERAERAELDALRREAEAEAANAEVEAERVGRLFEEGVVGRSETERAASEAERLRAAVEAREGALARRREELGVQEAAVAVRVGELETDRAGLRAAARSAEAEIARLQHRLDQHRVLAPIVGTIGRLTDLRPGAVVEAGTPMADIVPAGTFRVIADFPASAATGRIRPGQDATVRFDGFPWTQYGSLRAVTARVANEPTNGLVRVELEPDAASAPAIPLQHGLPGRVEVAVEETTPARLVLRVAGRTLDR